MTLICLGFYLMPNNAFLMDDVYSLVIAYSMMLSIAWVWRENALIYSWKSLFIGVVIVVLIPVFTSLASSLPFTSLYNLNNETSNTYGFFQVRPWFIYHYDGFVVAFVAIQFLAALIYFKDKRGLRVISFWLPLVLIFTLVHLSTINNYSDKVNTIGKTLEKLPYSDYGQNPKELSDFLSKEMNEKQKRYVLKLIERYNSRTLDFQNGYPLFKFDRSLTTPFVLFIQKVEGKHFLYISNTEIKGLNNLYVKPFYEASVLFLSAYLLLMASVLRTKSSRYRRNS